MDRVAIAPNAGALEARCNAARRSALIQSLLVPVVGAFLIHIANAIVISAFAGFIPALR